MQNNQQIEEMKNGFESEKRETKILMLNKEKQLQKAELKRQWITVYGLIGFLLCMLVFSFILFRLYKSRIKAYKILEKQKNEIREKNEALNQQNEEIKTQRDMIVEQNEELTQKNEEIASQRDEIVSHLHVSEKQRELILHQKKELTDSINYAQRIQHAILPPDYYVKKCLPDSFILYLPKDVVSGDFYYVEQVNGYVVFAAVDCTGHGVPGSMMSVIGYNLINQAVKINHITNPTEILSFLDAGVTETLRQEKGESGVNDGMDLAVCTLNIETNLLQCAGAYNGVVHIRNHELTEIKGDNFAIGVNYDGTVDQYSHHEILLSKGDSVYLYSDGYADQFGGPKGKKFKYKQLKELLLKNSQKPMPEQKDQLTNAFYQWKGELDQVDDVMVIGVRV